MNLQKPIIFFDIEATGTDVQKDRIVSLSASKFFGEPWTLKPVDELDILCHPGFPMSDEVIAVHGITNEVVAGAPLFEVMASTVRAFFAGCDLAGYNLLNFDIPMLWEELNRSGDPLDFSAVNVIDVGNIFKKKEERTLAAAVKFYCGREHTGAHDAGNDVDETLCVLLGQLRRYPDLDIMELSELAAFSRMDERLDLAGIIARNKDGEAVFNTKRNRGVRVVDDPGYAVWMLRSDFSENTKNVIRAVLGGTPAVSA